MPLISTASGAISGRLDHVLLLDSDSSGRESEVDAAQISLTIIYFFVRVMTTTFLVLSWSSSFKMNKLYIYIFLNEALTDDCEHLFCFNVNLVAQIHNTK